MVRVIDNGNELLHVKTAAFGFQAPSRGGAQLPLLAGNESLKTSLVLGPWF